MAAHRTAERKWHPVGAGELQVGNADCGRGREVCGFGKAFLINGREVEEGLAAAGSNVGWRTIGAKKPFLAQFVIRNLRRDASRHARVPGQRAMLGFGQFEPSLESGQQRCGGSTEHQEGGQGVGEIEHGDVVGPQGDRCMTFYRVKVTRA